jgi:RNA polymerase sigma-70 factor (ECF subfamily)
MGVSSTDSELVARALAGDQSAYRELVVSHNGPAFNLILRLVQNRALAEDLTQEAFIRAFERLATYDRDRQFSSWFLQVAHNVAIDYLRRKKIDTTSLDTLVASGFPADDELGESPEKYAERAAMTAAIDRGLARLRPEYRAAIVLHYQQGLGHAEISAVLRVPVGTIKTYLHRGRKELAEYLTAAGWGPVETLGPPNPVKAKNAS